MKVIRISTFQRRKIGDGRTPRTKLDMPTISNSLRTRAYIIVAQIPTDSLRSRTITARQQRDGPSSSQRHHGIAALQPVFNLDIPQVEVLCGTWRMERSIPPAPIMPPPKEWPPRRFGIYTTTSKIRTHRCTIPRIKSSPYSTWQRSGETFQKGREMQKTMKTI